MRLSKNIYCSILYVYSNSLLPLWLNNAYYYIIFTSKMFELENEDHRVEHLQRCILVANEI